MADVQDNPPPCIANAPPRHGSVLLLSVVILLFSVARTWSYSGHCFGFDFYQFWVVGQEIKAGGNPPVYTEPWRIETGERYWQIGHSDAHTAHQLVASDKRRTLQTYSTPLLYTFFSLIGTENYAHSILLYQVILFSCAAGSVALLCRLLNYSLAGFLLMLTVLLGWSQPYLSDIYVVNVNQIQLLLVAGLLWVEMRSASAWADLAGGVLLALIVLFKPNLLLIPALLGMMWIVYKQWAKLIGHIIGFAFAAVALIYLTGLRFGSAHAWLDWLPAFRALGLEHPPVATNNCSLVQILRESAGAVASSVAAILLAGGAFTCLWFTRQSKVENEIDNFSFAAGKRRAFLVIGIGCALPLLVSPIAWLHYFVLAIPLLLYTARPQSDEETRLRLIFRQTLAALALIFFCSSNITTEWFWLDSPQQTALRMAIITLGLFVFSLAEIKRDGKVFLTTDKH